jgi:hypothetical protein
MSDLIKSVFHSLLVCMLLPSEMLMAQEVPSKKSAPAIDNAQPTPDSIIDEIRTRISTFEAERDMLKSRFTPDDFVVRRLDEQLAGYRRLLEGDTEHSLTAIHLRHAEAGRMARRLHTLFPELEELIIADGRTNSILFRSNAEQRRIIQGIAEASDKETGDSASARGAKFTQPSMIEIELPADPAFVEPLRKIADAIAANNEMIRLSNAGTVASEPLQIEAELSIEPDVASDVVKIVIEELAKFGIATFRLSRSIEDKNMILLTATENTPWELTESVQRNFIPPAGFEFRIDRISIDRPISSNGEPSSALSRQGKTASKKEEPQTESTPYSEFMGDSSSSPTTSIAESRRRLANLEKPVVQLAEKVRAVETSLGKDHPDAVKQRAELRALVQKTFAERQKIQRAELAEFTRRLQRMQQAIETREKVAEKIVDRRVEELLHPDNSTESNSNLLDRTALPLPGSHDDVNPSALTTAAQLITKTYPVGNYVTATFFDQAIALQNPAPSLDAAADSIRQKAEELIAQISSHNKPAAISFDSARLQLVVSHTAEGHRALGELFATIKLPMQEKLTFSRCEVNEQIYSAFKDSPVWTAFDEFRNEVEDGGWIGVRKNEFVKWFERVLKESPAGADFGQPTSLVLAAGVPYQFDAGEIRVALTARINPASQKPQLRIDYADLSGRPSGTRMISDLEDLAVWIPSSEECITFLVYESAQGGSFPARDSLQKQDTAPPQPIAITPDVTEEVPGPEIVSLTLFEVADSTFMPSEDSAPEQSLALDNFDKQLESMLKNKTAKLIGKHTIETTRNQLATLHSGGKFEVPSSSPEEKAEVVFGTTIEITPRTSNGERVFQIIWNERVRNFENAVNGIPGIDEKRIEVNIKSPSPGGAGYLFGPLKGKNQTRRMFVHFLLHSVSSDEPPVSRREPMTEPPINDLNAGLRPRLQSVTGETPADDSFVRREFLPKSDAEKSVGRLVLVFANDAARRMVPALMVKHGERTLALTVGPATIVPADTPHAIDRTFLEFYNRDDVPTEYSQEFEFPDLRAYEANESLTEFRLENPVSVELSDQLSAIINQGQADFKVTSDAGRVTALEQSTTWELPSHSVTREFRGLIQIDQRLPEGTPLFKNGELAGITLLGTRFMTEDVPGSYVVPASRIFEVLRQVEAK